MTTTDSPESAAAPGDYFLTTQWTVVLAAGDDAAPQSRQALEELCGRYWYPLYAYVRRQGYSKEDAEDLTQSFFTRFLSRNYLHGLSSDKGRFRAFLLASLKHFLANEWDRANRLKRGGGVAPLSLDWQGADTQYQINPADHLSPDVLFDRAWAMTLLARVLAQLRQEYSGQAGMFEELKPFLTAGKGAVPYCRPAAALGMTEGAVRVAVHRMRGRYRELLRQEVAQTLSSPAQIEQEMRALFGAFTA